MDCVCGREETVCVSHHLFLGWFNHIAILWLALRLKKKKIKRNQIHAFLMKDMVEQGSVQTLV